MLFQRNVAFEMFGIPNIYCEIYFIFKKFCVKNHNSPWIKSTLKQRFLNSGVYNASAGGPQKSGIQCKISHFWERLRNMKKKTKNI